MTAQDDIKELEASIQRAKALVELGSSLERLSLNRDFKAIVLEGYFKQEAIRLVHLRSDPSMQTLERQADIVKQMDAIAGFSQYLLVIQQQAYMAKRSVASDEQSMEEILAGEDA